MLATLLLSLAGAALASNATGPHALRITGKTNSSINGYGSPCHAGAAIEGICYSTTSYPNFYFNYSSYSPDTGEVYPYGWVEYELPYTGPNNTQGFEPEGLVFNVNLFSNVAAGLFFPGYDTATIFQYNKTGSLYVSNGFDDRSNNATYPNPQPTFGNVSSFHLCYQWTGGYYYQSIAWVSGTSPPQNPSCQPVDLAFVL